MSTSINNVTCIKIPSAHDKRGLLAVIEGNTIPFDIKRVFYTYDMPSDILRGGHAHKTLHQCIIAVSGSFEVLLKDSKYEKRVILNKPDKGLLLVPGVWCDIVNFSSGCVCLVLASEEYSEDDYIRNFEDFLRFKKL